MFLLFEFEDILTDVEQFKTGNVNFKTKGSYS